MNNGLSRESIKYVAAAAMLINHIGLIFLPDGTLLQEIFVAVGYFTAITQLYFLTEGFYYTRSRKKYLQRLVLLALVSQIPFSMAFAKNGILEFRNLNMGVTLTLCFCMIWVMETEPRQNVQSIIVLGILLVSWLCDWGIMAPVYTLLFVRARRAADRQAETRKAFGIAVLSFGVICFLTHVETLDAVRSFGYALLDMVGMAAAAVCLLHFYSGRRMKSAGRIRDGFRKWFFYAFYPGHLLILGLIRIWLAGH